MKFSAKVMFSAVIYSPFHWASGGESWSVGGGNWT